MDFIKIAKVPDVVSTRLGKSSVGTLHLTTHHLIFKDSETRRELWICYPIIGGVERRQSSNPPGGTTPIPQQLQQVNPYSGISASSYSAYQNPQTSSNSNSSEKPADPAYLLSRPTIRIKCKDFVFVAFTFPNDQIARDTFDTLVRLTCNTNVNQLYAFNYKPISSERNFNGWKFYDPIAEFTRQGALDSGSRWRVTNVNADYQLSSTYPAVFLVPSAISDTVLNYAAKFRSKSRIAALSYYHKLNGCTITRCSQPMVGLKQARSAQDEKIATEIFVSNQHQLPNSINNNTLTYEYPDKLPGITTKQDNLIVDARPTANAMAQTALGAGTENMENYKGARKVYLGIDNIHVMRDSLNKVMDALKEGDVSNIPPSKDLLHRSNWLRYISTILTGAITVADHVHAGFSHVLIHCSDGWDRTTQLSSIAQIILDPYYRTFDGFIILVEKEWVSFGHRFAERSGHLNSEKNFVEPFDSPFGGAHQIFKDVGSKFVKSGTSAVAALGGRGGNKNADTASATSSTSGFGTNSLTGTSGTNMKYTAPVFHQFLDSVYQLIVQFPDRFEFGERFLRRLLYHTYSCQYGTFLYNSELERREVKVEEHTRSVWDYFLARRNEFVNNKSSESDSTPDYDRDREFNYPADKIVLQPNAKQLKYWSELFGRPSEEMNTRPKPEPVYHQSHHHKAQGHPASLQSHGAPSSFSRISPSSKPSNSLSSEVSTIPVSPITPITEEPIKKQRPISSSETQSLSTSSTSSSNTPVLVPSASSSGNMSEVSLHSQSSIPDILASTIPTDENEVELSDPSYDPLSHSLASNSTSFFSSHSGAQSRTSFHSTSSGSNTNNGLILGSSRTPLVSNSQATPNSSDTANNTHKLSARTSTPLSSGSASFPSPRLLSASGSGSSPLGSAPLSTLKPSTSDQSDSKVSVVDDMDGKQIEHFETEVSSDQEGDTSLDPKLYARLNAMTMEYDDSTSSKRGGKLGRFGGLF